MINPLFRNFISLFIAYTLLMSLCSSTSMAKTSGFTKPSAPARMRFSSQKRVHLSQNMPRAGMRNGEFLVRFRQNASLAEQRGLAVSIGVAEFKPLRGRSRVVKMILSPNQSYESVALALQNSPLIEAAEPNHLIYQDAATNSFSERSSGVAQQTAMPNDPRFPEQWSLQNLTPNERVAGLGIQVTSAWSLATGQRDLIIAVIDSGIDFSHADLKNQQWVNRRETRDGKDDDSNGYTDDAGGWNFVENNGNVSDVSGHGTNVAGIIGAEGDNGVGITGVLWHASLMSLRVLDENGVGDIASAIEALDYATEHGAQVINLSWGSDAKSVFLKDAIRRSAKFGAVTVCSAGNNARDLSLVPHYPASFDLPNLISVAATDGFDNPLPTSNFGFATPTISAPGIDILTTTAGLAKAGLNPARDYEAIVGTSAAAAIVSGVAGLLKSLSATIEAHEIKEVVVRGARVSEALRGKNLASGVVSVAGGLAAANAHQTENGYSQENTAGERNNYGSANQFNPSLSQNSSRRLEPNKANPVKRRRNVAGPQLPNLDLQKNVSPPQPPVGVGRSSLQRNCSPWLPNCVGQHVASPQVVGSTTNGPRLMQKDANRFLASQHFSIERLFAVALQEKQFEDLAPLMRNILAVGNSVANDLDVDIDSNSSYTSLFTITADNYVTGFYQGVLARNPNTIELTFWKNQLKDATSLGAPSVLATAQYLGSALFLSGEYAVLATNNTDYVTDLYWGYYQHAPDSNLSYWVGQVTSVGREAVRAAFAASSEFSTFVGTIDVGSYPTTTGNFSTARIDILNRSGISGEDLLSGNINFGIPILSLPGRAGLNVGLNLTYNSRVWSKANSTIAMDIDRGFPSPGFRLGFPVVQPRFYNSTTGTTSYLLITPGGGHVELRRVGSTNVYESADSTHTQLTDNTTSLKVRTIDGTQMNYSQANGQWVCTEIKDRNGNYITINYNSMGNLSSIVDTLERTITFNYDSNSRLQSITQPWMVGGSSVTRTWATFSYANVTIDTNFSSVYMLWPQDNATLSMLTEVGFADGSNIDFEYNAFGQVNKVKRNASDNSLQSQTRYVYDTPTADVPRVTDRYDWARYWNGDSNGAVASAEEARTQLTTGLSGGIRTTPDNTSYKEFYASSTWQKGLITGTEISVGGGSPDKWTTTSWTQDSLSVLYFVNPKITETNVYDSASNRRRTTITYTDYSLPDVVTEYEANATTVYRQTDTDYVTSSTYINNRVIGLPSKIETKDVNNTLKSKVEFTYDSSGAYFTNVTGKDRHDDTNYGSGFVTGRGNLCIVKRYEIGGSGSIETDRGYNSLGQVVFTRDGADHQTNISYTDSFSDGINTRNTNAYPTVLEDADENDYLTQYNYDHGGITRTEDPLGAVETQTYDSLGRPDAITNLASTSDTTKQARIRFEYGPNYLLKYVRGFSGTSEAYTNTQFDGAGRVRAVASDFPGSTGGYKAAYTYYDIMGRAIEQANATEVNSSWVPTGDDSAGFASIVQTLDWKGRSLVTTNQDDTYKTASYTGCGCAGGEVVTLIDEVGRKQKTSTDVFGRPVKLEVYSSPTMVNSTSVTTYNILDQPTQVREYAGNSSSSTFQDTTMQYDGYARLWKTHRPEFASNTYETVTYNTDDTRATVTDPRAAVTTFTYNDRHLVTGVSYSAASGIPTAPSVSFTYDAAGNRLTMTSTGTSVEYVYDTASRLTSESQSLSGVTGEFTLNYTYHPAGPVATVQDPFSRTVSYTYDKTGQLTGMGATNYPNLTSFVTSAQYRAWGTAKRVDYGNGVTQSSAFNERMQPTTHLLEDLRLIDNSTYSIGSTYDYYSDGRLFHAFYNNSGGSYPKFDRKYQYDFAGRISEVYTGREAHDQSSVTPRDNPYRHSFQYDAFGHISQRSGMLWRQALATDAVTYTNNQRSDWSYDAAGNPVYTESGSFAPNAAGQSTHAYTSQTDSLGGGDYRMFDAIISHGLDGDGLTRYRSEYRYVEESIGEDFDVTEVTTENYFLWSTVLGAMIAELDEEGDLKTGFVYAGRRLARLIVTPSSTTVKFDFTDTQTGTTFQASHTGQGGVDREFDSVGAQIPKTDPYIFSKRLYSDLKPNGQLFIGGGDPYRFDGTCQLDGMPESCDLVHRLLNAGALALKIGTGSTAKVVPIESFGAIFRSRQWNPNSGRQIPKGPGAWGDAGFWTEYVVTFEPELLGSRLEPMDRQRKRKTPKQPKIDPAVLKKAIADCISEMWPDYALEDFKTTQKPRGRNNDDRFNGETKIKDVHNNQQATIVSDPTPDAKTQAAMDAQGLGGATPRENPWNPYWGYVRWGRDTYGSATSEYVYPALYGANKYLQTQIHELGVSLSRLTERFYPNNWRKLGSHYFDPGDMDNGNQFEDCVGNKVYQQMNLTPQRMNAQP